jgi:hypothetical protein
MRDIREMMIHRENKRGQADLRGKWIPRSRGIIAVRLLLLLKLASLELTKGLFVVRKILLGLSDLGCVAAQNLLVECSSSELLGGLQDLALGLDMLVDLLDLLVELVSLEGCISTIHYPRALDGEATKYHGCGHAEEPRGWGLEKTVGMAGNEKEGGCDGLLSITTLFSRNVLFRLPSMPRIAHRAAYKAADDGFSLSLAVQHALHWPPELVHSRHTDIIAHNPLVFTLAGASNGTPATHDRLLSSKAAGYVVEYLRQVPHINPPYHLTFTPCEQNAVQLGLDHVSDITISELQHHPSCKFNRSFLAVFPSH